MDRIAWISALETARASKVQASRKLDAAKAERRRLLERQRRILGTPTSDEGNREYMVNAARLYGLKSDFDDLEPIVRDLEKLVVVLSHLRLDWTLAMPGVGTGGAWFFVRNYRLEDGKPAAYDPFWVEDIVEDQRGERAELAARSPRGPEQDGWEPAHFAVPRPFGSFEEAATEPCPVCQASAFVIGHKELTHWDEDSVDKRPYVQSLDLLCLACERLTPMARREDARPLKLHP